jgi:integrase
MERPEPYFELQTLAPELRRRLTDLLRQGTPANTLRAYERDLVYITAWKRAAFDADLAWPESEEVALRFVLDHSEDLAAQPPDYGPRRIAEALIAAGLRRSLARPAPATVDRRIASWRAFHGFRNLDSPFEAPGLRRARKASRRAAAHKPAPKAARPITRDVLDRLVEACPPTLAGMRDRALLETAWASGGRRRSELAGLRREDLDLERFDATGEVKIALLATKTTEAGKTPRLLLRGTAARRLVAWLDAAKIDAGPVFRAVSKADKALPRGLSESGVRDVIRAALRRAGYEKGYSSAHGLRSGFLTEAARSGIPLQAAAQLSLHRSIVQAAQYYRDAELSDNPAVDLRDRGAVSDPETMVARGAG